MSVQPMSAVGDLVEPVSTWTPERDEPDGSFNYIDLSSVDQEAKIISGARELACAEAPSRARQLVRSGDVLVSTVRPNLNAVALVPPDLDGATASTGFCVLRPRPDKLDDGYLFHWVRSPRFIGQMVRRATGASYPAVSDRIVCESKLPAPPLPEQRRIAEILDKADTLRAKRRAALAQLDTLNQSIFLDMFGDPATNPKGWPKYRLGQVADFFAGSTLPEGINFKEQTGGFFLLKVSDMNLAGNEVYLSSCQQWSATSGAEASTCPAGSIVIPKRGGAIGTNKKRITVRDSVLDPNLMAIWPRPEKMRLSFLYHWFLRLDLATITSGSSVPQLNKQDLDPLKVPVPPLSLQELFLEKWEAMENLNASHSNSLATLDDLFSTLQHRAFRGEL